MNSRLTTFIMALVQVTLLFTLAACQDTIPYRSTTGAQVTDPNQNQCPEGYEPKTETNEAGEEVIVCTLIPLVRPNDAVFWKSGHCICKDKKAVSSGSSCPTFCSDKVTNGSETLYASFNVSDTIGLGSLAAWCGAALPGQDTTENPSCEIQAEDPSGNVTAREVSIKAKGNSIEVMNVQGFILEDISYLLTIVERTSGAKSDTAQIIKYGDNGEGPILGPIKTAIITQYQCMRRIAEVSEGNGDLYYVHAFPLHFYFVTGLPPSPLPGGVPSIFCHDIQRFGPVDSAFFPRLNETPGVFNLWDVNDPRFSIDPQDGRVIANASIVKKTTLYGGSVPANSNFFQEFRWQISPVIEEEGSNNNNGENPVLGLYMAPWINSTNHLSFCLNKTHYDSDTPLYRAIGDVLGKTATEGIYIAEKEPTSRMGSDGNYYREETDRVLINETELKSAWFEIYQGAPRRPSSDNVAGKAIYVHYPINKDSPYVSTLEQRLYRVKSLSELAGGNNNGQPVPHDKKIGCVPKF